MCDVIPRYLKGIIVPMLTPCHEDGSLDDEAIRALVRHFKSLGFVSALFVRSGVGQMYTFSVADAKHIFDVATEEAGEIPVMAGAAGEYDNHPAHRPDPDGYAGQTVELVSYASKKRCCAAVLALPVALRKEPGRPLSETIYDYYHRVSARAELPLVVYQPPALEKAYRMTPELLRRISRLKMIVAMKYSVPERKAFAAMADVVRGTNFALICGIEEFYIHAMPLGATGVIAGGCNTHPEIIYAIQRAYQNGNPDEAAKAQEDLLRALHVFDGLDWPTAAIGYMSRRVPGVKPFTRTELMSYDAGIIDRVERELDQILQPYRNKS